MAENGFNKPVYDGVYEYTQAGAALTGVGSNGKFKAVADGTYSSFTVNGVACTVKNGDETSIELKAGNWYDFILDTEDNTVNFKQGGAGLNFKIVGGTTQPENPSENTIWVNTNSPINNYFFDSIAPTTVSTNDVFFECTELNSEFNFNAIKKNFIKIRIKSCRQWNGSSWVAKSVKLFKNGSWAEPVVILKNSSTSKTASNQNGIFNVIAVDVTPYKQIKINCTTSYSPFISGDGYSSYGVYNRNTTSGGTGDYAIVSNALVEGSGGVAVTHNGEYTVDVSSLTGVYYIGCAMYAVRSQSATTVLKSVKGIF